MQDLLACAALLGMFFFGRWTQRRDDAIEEICCRMEHRDRDIAEMAAIIAAD